MGKQFTNVDAVKNKINAEMYNKISSSAFVFVLICFNYFGNKIIGSLIAENAETKAKIEKIERSLNIDKEL